MRTFKIFALISLMAIYSCKKDRSGYPPAPVPPVAPGVNLIRIELEEMAQPAELFGYDAARQLISRSAYLNNTMPAAFTHLNNKPVRADMISTTDGRVMYSYQLLYAGDKLDKINMIYTGADPGNKTPMVIWKCSYTNGSLTMVTAYGPDETAAGSHSRMVYTYYPNGDLKRSAVEECFDNNGFKLTSEVSYEYDDQNNPMQLHARYLTVYSPYLHSAAHNIVKEIWTEGQNRKVTQVVTRSYAYQKDGYPLTALTSYSYPGDAADNYTEKTHYVYTDKK
ncbi:hypothetical protein EWM62_00295 [Mucilaginibacter terrigena]|uniref:DUF4595 domain-containing protein n=1 Tax=Mucilaginibacter terrigena TaxID=2492395 RepID=A0A4Q5LQZ1_9SPHI|nr:hypothetical protein [Mucilaginibacter terrigena]RYU91916.1 hypothetical protein EWM62_00295 [Mucilaginibacter terrigena]